VLEDSDELLKGDFLGPGVHLRDYMVIRLLFSMRILINFWMLLFITPAGTSSPQIGG
jgi:hypothetical protein